MLEQVKNILIFALAIIMFGVASSSIAQDKTEMLLVSDVNWTPLNPARGKLGPKAGNLWGDRTGVGASGFLVKFTDGFSSPPHIHNITYRGVVISGLVHNDDPNAEKAWMPAGSYWTQAAGEVHITSAMGSSNIAYIEIEKSPYLVMPVNQSFETSDKSINVNESNIVWLDTSNTHWIQQSKDISNKNTPKIAFLWGAPQGDQLHGTLVKLPSGFSGKIHANQSILRSVIIQGNVNYQLKNKTDKITLEPGSYFGSNEESAHQLSVDKGKECIIYIRTRGRFNLVMD